VEGEENLAGDLGILRMITESGYSVMSETEVIRGL
jgi:hypothetical protein